MGGDGTARRRMRAAALTLAGLIAGLGLARAADAIDVETTGALYPRDGRRDLTAEDRLRFPGAGVLWCRRPDGVPRKAAAAWLIGAPTLVMLNAHNFRNRQLETTRIVSDCYFQIGGRNYDFVADSLQLGVARDAERLHITDDWALLRLVQAAEAPTQPLPEAPPDLTTGDLTLPVTMVSPGGHGNYRGEASLETCTVRRVDPPTEGDTRRARHDCNDGYGGSGSGLFDEAGRMVAMQSASLSMNSRHAFDIEFHYGSALLIEGALLDALREAVRRPQPSP
ncbi:Trypsin-like peptidase domain-containing protein [Methylorubrum salsuginis]|uniref:Trypsin-like peptidase domain-containing protein n=2 Tax=Methylorubrum salsuginis TaxID=414703 RepID=A0A1I4BFI0_9HYPH|nr:serine protease [Methylorubrum salsuginis]SFK67223.1 Trypsin-like peptidase domain-containing protein [Methylorubrum salsuginis]